MNKKDALIFQGNKKEKVPKRLKVIHQPSRIPDVYRDSNISYMPISVIINYGKVHNNKASLFYDLMVKDNCEEQSFKIISRDCCICPPQRLRSQSDMH